jgi:NAD(P)-dependent dehydrogenase (short-subunit alcohol dehydrogenase family)
MTGLKLNSKTVLITGAARRIGHELAIAVAREGGNVVLHHSGSDKEAELTYNEVISLGLQCTILKADLSDLHQAEALIKTASQNSPLFAVVNNAAIYETIKWDEVNIENWQEHLNLNLGAPFFLSQAFARSILPSGIGRIVNILDWRALRPGADHLPYTISKNGLAALTRSLAIALAPQITVNGMALGAILPPSDEPFNPNILKFVPANRWGSVEEVSQTLIFLLTGPEYITGEIIHVDGGRHLI